MALAPAQEHSQNGSALVAHPVGPSENTLNSPTFESAPNKAQKGSDLLPPTSIAILN